MRPTQSLRQAPLAAGELIPVAYLTRVSPLSRQLGGTLSDPVRTLGCQTLHVDQLSVSHVSPLSSLYENVRGMGVSLVVETGDGVVDRAFESIGIGDGSIGQIMLLEVAPASFDSLPRT